MSEHRYDFHLHIHDEQNSRILSQILAQLRALAVTESHMSAELDALTAQVEATDNAQQSALVLINGIAARLAEAGTDPAKLQALTESLKTNSDQLAAAVTANTPAES